MDLTITRENRIICEECWNADNSNADSGNTFLASTKIDDRLSKDNLKLYEVKWVYGGGDSFKYPKIELHVGDVVMTEALGIDITLEGKKYKIFDTDFIVAKVEDKNMNNKEDKNMNNKVELTSNNGKVHAVVEKDAGKELGLDLVSEMQTIIDSEGKAND